MNLTSLTFLSFTLIVIVIYYLVPGKSQNILLLLASYIFYCSWDWHFAIILGAITIFNFYLTKLFQGSLTLKVNSINKNQILLEDQSSGSEF